MPSDKNGSAERQEKLSRSPEKESCASRRAADSRNDNSKYGRMRGAASDLLLLRDPNSGAPVAAAGATDVSADVAFGPRIQLQTDGSVLNPAGPSFKPSRELSSSQEEVTGNFLKNDVPEPSSSVLVSALPEQDSDTLEPPAPPRRRSRPHRFSEGDAIILESMIDIRVRDPPELAHKQEHPDWLAVILEKEAVLDVSCEVNRMRQKERREIERLKRYMDKTNDEKDPLIQGSASDEELLMPRKYTSHYVKPSGKRQQRSSVDSEAEVSDFDSSEVQTQTRVKETVPTKRVKTSSSLEMGRDTSGDA
ncbi:unnamed protein product [Amoebophrya sp. A25]|nr:unnamed protein product [Amoebophrya sp. A25]|eukprot:GSA25T00011522001.1